MNLEHFCSQMSTITGQVVDPKEPATLVGAFQQLRPDPSLLEAIFMESDEGADVYSRLCRIYEAAGEPRRADGMKDAFFIVRRPAFSTTDSIRQRAQAFFENLSQLAAEQDLHELADCLCREPEIRVLEGAAPKHPKADNEKSELMHAITKIGPTVTEKMIEKDQFATFIKRAIYFLACDAFLRDYVLWPLIDSHSKLEDPYDAYFDLWQHGAKIRIFNERQIDLYFPRREEFGLSV